MVNFSQLLVAFQSSNSKKVLLVGQALPVLLLSSPPKRWTAVGSMSLWASGIRTQVYTLGDIIYFDVWYNGYVQCTVKCVCVQPRDFGTRCILLVCEGSNVRAI